MKIFRELIIIFSLYFIGIILSKFIFLPANIIGMLLLLLLLVFKIIKLESVETVSDFFLKHLAFFFIPATVNLMNSYDLLKINIVKITILCIVVNIIVLFTTGKVAQFLLRGKNNG